tara:strand:+ start:4113 stop:4586 length:474 start_codon:yes stop_codon:yes gene_type:complete
MILDKTLELRATGGDFSQEPGTVNLHDAAIDLGVARDIGQIADGPLYCVIVIETAADGGATTTGTMSFQVVSDGTSTISTTTQSVHVATKAFTAAELPAGRVISIPLPPGNDQEPYERYLGLQVVQAVEGEDDCVGRAFLSTHPFGGVDKSYPDAVN